MTKQGEAIHVCRGHRPAAGVFVAVAMIGLVLTVSGSAEDWTQWRGADRLAVWHETGIVERLPDELEVSWRTPIRSGYSRKVQLLDRLADGRRCRRISGVGGRWFGGAAAETRWIASLAVAIGTKSTPQEHRCRRGLIGCWSGAGR